MNAIFRRNWLIARRNNLVTLGWLTPVITILFNWLSTLTEEDTVTGAMGIGRLAIFQPFTVVIIYLFVNALVSFLVAAYLTTRELEDKSLSQIRLTQLTPFNLIGGHFLTVAAIMLPQMVLFHIAVFVYALFWLPPVDQGPSVNFALIFGVFLMNMLNSFALTSLLCFGLFGRAFFFVVLGGIAAFFAVPINFTIFYIADQYGLGVLAVTALQILPLGAMLFLSIALGKYMWHAEWR